MNQREKKHHVSLPLRKPHGVRQIPAAFFVSCPEASKYWTVADRNTMWSLGVEIRGWTLKNLGGYAWGGEGVV
jgi:hypothetical protein